MTITVNIGDADLNELLARVEAGEDVILARDGSPVAKIVGVTADASDQKSRKEILEEVRAFRDRMPNITQDEIAEWKAVGRR